MFFQLIWAILNVISFKTIPLPVVILAVPGIVRMYSDAKTSIKVSGVNFFKYKTEFINASSLLYFNK